MIGIIFIVISLLIKIFFLLLYCCYLFFIIFVLYLCIFSCADVQQKKLYMHLFVNRFVILYETPIRIYDMFVCVCGGGGGTSIFFRGPPIL